MRGLDINDMLWVAGLALGFYAFWAMWPPLGWLFLCLLLLGAARLGIGKRGD